MSIDRHASFVELIRNPQKLRDAMNLLANLERLKVQVRDSNGTITVSPLLNAGRNAVIDLTFSESAIPPVIPPNPGAADLVAFWPMDEAGGNATDTAGSNILSNGSVTFVGGKIGNAALFTGGSTLSRNNASLVGLSFTGSFSFSFWLKLTSLPSGTTYPIITKFRYIGGDDRQYAITYEDDGAGGYRLNADLSGNGLTSLKRSTTITFTTGVWHHIVCTFNAGNGDVKTYINGSLAATIPGSTFVLYNGNADFIMGTLSGTGLSLQGALDMVAAFARVLSPTEVDFLYNGGTGRAP